MQHLVFWRGSSNGFQSAFQTESIPKSLPRTGLSAQGSYWKKCRGLYVCGLNDPLFSWWEIRRYLSKASLESLLRDSSLDLVSQQHVRARGKTRGCSSLLLCILSLSGSGFDLAIQVLLLVNSIQPINVTWICQTLPDPAKLSRLDLLQVDVCLDPPQDVIPSLYRGHDAMLFTSYYEAWGMPILEGMA